MTLSPFLKDAAERVIWTFVQAAGGALADQLSTGHVTWRAAAYAGLLAVLKVFAARRVGDQSTASLP